MASALTSEWSASGRSKPLRRALTSLDLSFLMDLTASMSLGWLPISSVKLTENEGISTFLEIDFTEDPGDGDPDVRDLVL